MDKCPKDTFGYLGTEPMALREQLDQLAAALHGLTKAEGAEAIRAASDAAQRIAERASAIIDKLADNADTAAAAKGRSQVEQAVRKQPLAAVAMAAAAGFLLAMLVRR